MQDIALMKREDRKTNIKCWSALFSPFSLSLLSRLYSYFWLCFPGVNHAQAAVVDSEVKHEKKGTNNSRCFTERACWSSSPLLSGTKTFSFEDATVVNDLFLVRHWLQFTIYMMHDQFSQMCMFFQCVGSFFCLQYWIWISCTTGCEWHERMNRGCVSSRQ